MALRLSDLETRPTLTKEDWFEVEGYQDHASGKVSGAQIANLCKNLSNGGFYGVVSKSLDEFTYADAGVYFWEGTPPISGMPTMGILEIICSRGVEASDQNSETPTFIQRLTNGAEVYTRTISGSSMSEWGVLRNKNGNKILSGVSSDANVNFNSLTGRSASNPFFNQTPVVTITPYNANPSNYVYIANLQSIDQNGFSVARFQSAMQAVMEETTDHDESTVTDDSEAHTKTTVSNKTVTTTVTRGAWEAGSFPYYWTATVDG